MLEQTIKNSKKVKEFLELEDIKKSKIYKKLKCSEEEAYFLQFLITKYVLDSKNEFLISEALQAYFLKDNEFSEKMYENDEDIDENDEDIEEYTIQEQNQLVFEENFDFIDFIPNVKKLLHLGWIFSGNLNFETYSEIDFLSLYIHIDQSLLFLIQNDEVSIGDYKQPFKKNKYETYFEYLQDNFLLIELLYKRHLFRMNLVVDDAPKSISLKNNIEKIEKRIQDKLNATKIQIPFKEFTTKYKIEKEQQTILMALLKEEYTTSNTDTLRDENVLLGLIYDLRDENNFEKLSIFNFSQFTENQTLEYEDNIVDFDYSIKKFYYLSEFMLKAFKPLIKVEDVHKEQHLQLQMEKISKANDNIFEILQPDISINDVVLNEQTQDLINILMKQTEPEIKDLLVEWGIKKDTDTINGRIIFYGKPGTGKTMTALAIGNLLKQKVLSFDCSKILDMYVGESEKNVRKIFETYKEIVKETGENPILLLNEADQFLSSRNVGKNINSTDKMINQMQNIFLEQIENFNGIIIATTNLITNLDKAFSRRFNYKIEFKLPNSEQRKIIWEKQIPHKAKYDKDFNINELNKFELSGGQINLIIKNTALKVACRNNKEFSNKDFIDEIKKELDGAFENNKKLGFNVNN